MWQVCEGGRGNVPCVRIYAYGNWLRAVGDGPKLLEDRCQLFAMLRERARRLGDEGGRVGDQCKKEEEEGGDVT